MSTSPDNATEVTAHVPQDVRGSGIAAFFGIDDFFNAAGATDRPAPLHKPAPEAGPTLEDLLRLQVDQDRQGAIAALRAAFEYIMAHAPIDPNDGFATMPPIAVVFRRMCFALEDRGVDVADPILDFNSPQSRPRMPRSERRERLEIGALCEVYKTINSRECRSQVLTKVARAVNKGPDRIRKSDYSWQLVDRCWKEWRAHIKAPEQVSGPR